MDYNALIARAAREYVQTASQGDKLATQRAYAKLNWIVMAEKYQWDESTFPDEYT